VMEAHNDFFFSTRKAVRGAGPPEGV